jgi:signal transduction histidine kinase
VSGPDSKDDPEPPVTLLLIEDNPHDAELLKWALQDTDRLCFNVHWTTTIEAALERVVSMPVDLVLLDLNLPDSDGMKTLLKVKSAAPDLPVIVLTALTDESLALEAVKMGADDFLMKGKVSTDGILRCVRYSVERRRFQTRLRETEERAKKRSAEVRKTETNLEAVLSSTDQGLQQLDPMSKVALMNQAVEALLGYTSNKAIRQWLRDLAQGIARDLLMMQQREEFMASLAHDLKTPLVGADRALALLWEGSIGDLSEAQVELVGKVRQSNKALLQMIQNLLDVYRWESGAQTLHMEHVDISTLIKSCVDEIRIIADAKRVWLVAEDIPREPHSVHIDPLAIRRVLINLLSNAVKFTADGGTVELEVGFDADNLSIAVRDTGIGIAAADQAKLFRRFVQAENLSRERGVGSGLGLHLCRQIIEAHGGTITLESEVGKGSVFTIMLPQLNSETERPLD